MYEYKSITVSRYTLVAHANKQAEDGWRVVTMGATSPNDYAYGIVLLLEREKPSEPS